MTTARRITALAVTLAACALPATARPQSSSAEVLQLDAAVATALRNNHRIGGAEARVDVAGARADSARSRRLPRLHLSESFLYTTNPVAVFGSLLEQESFGQANFALDSLNDPDPLTNFETRIEVAQPVWTGGRISGAIDAAELQHAAAEASRDRETQEVIHAVVEAYSGAVLAEYQLDVARQARETANAHVELVGDLREAGLVLEADLLQARVRASETEEMVIRAESGVAISRAGLNAAMGVDLDRPVRLPDAEEFLDAAATADALEDLLDAALQSRPDLRAATRRLEAAARMVDVARAGRLPTVGIGGAWEMNEEDFPGASGTNWTLQAVARWTIFDGDETGARVAMARGRREEANRGRELLIDGIGLQVRRAWHELQAAAQRITEAELAVSMAESSLRTVEDRYQEGLTELVHLLDAQTALTRARFRDVAARRDVLVARAALDLAVGRSAPSRTPATAAPDDDAERAGGRR